MRSTLASNAGADLGTIFALGNWSSNNTYQRFYQRGIRLTLEHNNISRQILGELVCIYSISQLKLTVIIRNYIVVFIDLGKKFFALGVTTKYWYYSVGIITICISLLYLKT